MTTFVDGAGDRAVEHHLERLVAGLARVEREIVAEHDEAERRPCEPVRDVGQVDQVGLVDFDEAQPLAVRSARASP